MHTSLLLEAECMGSTASACFFGLRVWCTVLCCPLMGKYECMFRRRQHLWTNSLDTSYQMHSLRKKRMPYLMEEYHLWDVHLLLLDTSNLQNEQIAYLTECSQCTVTNPEWLDSFLFALWKYTVQSLIQGKWKSWIRDLQQGSQPRFQMPASEMHRADSVREHSEASETV